MLTLVDTSTTNATGRHLLQAGTLDVIQVREASLCSLAAVFQLRV